MATLNSTEVVTVPWGILMFKIKGLPALPTHIENVLFLRNAFMTLNTSLVIPSCCVLFLMLWSMPMVGVCSVLLVCPSKLGARWLKCQAQDKMIHGHGERGCVFLYTSEACAQPWAPSFYTHWKFGQRLPSCWPCFSCPRCSFQHVKLKAEFLMFLWLYLLLVRWFHFRV